MVLTKNQMIKLAMRLIPYTLGGLAVQQPETEFRRILELAPQI
jgi:hypothetical protein